MTRPFSLSFKRKMITRLTGNNAVSARQLAGETGVSQETLSRWLREARRLPMMPKKKSKKPKSWTVDDKVRLMAKAARLAGEELHTFLAGEGLSLGELEAWRLALDEGGRASTATTKQIRKLERELARKEKALAEAAALLVLKKKVGAIWGDEDDNTNDRNES
jgi:transposase-like protein